MVQLTMQVPEDLAKRIQPIRSWLPTILELSLVGFRTLATETATETIQFLLTNPSPQEVLNYHASEHANYNCEYCRLPQSAAFHKHEPDHIIPLQHGGETENNNLALACMHCNRYKGPNVAFYDPTTGKLVPLFNPRIQNWENHFELKGAII